MFSRVFGTPLGRHAVQTGATVGFTLGAVNTHEKNSLKKQDQIIACLAELDNEVTLAKKVNARRFEALNDKIVDCSEIDQRVTDVQTNVTNWGAVMIAGIVVSGSVAMAILNKQRQDYYNN